MTPKKLESAIYAWFESHYPDGPHWQEAGWHCFESAPLELKMFPAFDAVDYNLTNGGWAQLLWNCYSNWRRLLDICEQGYRLIGAGAQAAAIPALRARLAADEAECAAFMKQADATTFEMVFADYTARSYGTTDAPEESPRPLRTRSGPA